jgi:hypothetical protein
VSNSIPTTIKDISTFVAINLYLHNTLLCEILLSTPVLNIVNVRCDKFLLPSE